MTSSPIWKQVSQQFNKSQIKRVQHVCCTLVIPLRTLSYDIERFIRGISLKEHIEERAVEIARYIVENNATVRQAAKKYGISKSTVHKDITDRLQSINPALASRARVVLDINKSERHLRGGQATREKYKNR